MSRQVMVNIEGRIEYVRCGPPPAFTFAPVEALQGFQSKAGYQGRPIQAGDPGRHPGWDRPRPKSWGGEQTYGGIGARQCAHDRMTQMLNGVCAFNVPCLAIHAFPLD